MELKKPGEIICSLCLAQAILSAGVGYRLDLVPSLQLLDLLKDRRLLLFRRRDMRVLLQSTVARMVRTTTQTSQPTIYALLSSDMVCTALSVASALAATEGMGGVVDYFKVSRLLSVQSTETALDIYCYLALTSRDGRSPAMMYCCTPYLSKAVVDLIQSYTSKNSGD